MGAKPETPRGPAWALLHRDWLVGALLLGAALFAYAPVWHAGLIWDDDGHVTRADLRSLHGLWRIWFEPGATQQYYPLLHSAFWLEHRLWGDLALGYHLANVVLHAAAAALLYRILRLLALPGAALAAAAFALHPVCVESVAWISEQKNTLSAALCFAAALAYLCFDRDRRRPWYAFGTVLFALSLATKTVSATLPASLLVILWWKRGRVSWAADVLPLLPWFAMGICAGLVTAWVEQAYIGAKGAAFDLSAADRVIIAGRALWFYAGKVFWPADLVFIYPRWGVDSGAPWQYLYPATAAAAFGFLFALRRRARGPLAAALLFAGTLFPALGFINAYPFLYSFVADHFQYVALAVAVSAASAALLGASARLPLPGRVAVLSGASLAVAALGLLTYAQCGAYADPATLWRRTIAGNPRCWMACENLGGVYLRQGSLDLAVAQFRRAIEIKSDDDGALNELGVALLQQGNTGQALAQFQKALEIAPDRAETHINIGVALLALGRPDEAAEHSKRALSLEPGNVRARGNLATAYMQEGHWSEAAGQFRAAAESDPLNADLWSGLGSALMRSGRFGDAAAQFKKALELGDDSAAAHLNFATALAQAGDEEEAVAHFRRAIATSPGLAKAHEGLANVLLRRGAVSEAVSHFQQAVALDDRYAEAHFNLANTLLQLGRTREAIGHFQRAIELWPGFAPAHYNLANAFLQEGRLDDAAAQLQATLKLEPASAQVMNDLGVVLSEEGRTEEAASSYKRALDAKPDFAGAAVNLGNLYLGSGRPAEAAGSYARALQLEPNNARVRNNLGIALLKQGLTAEAEAQFRRALEIEPSYEEARRNLSIVTGRPGAP